MADKIIQDETLSGIANAIRMQTMSSAPIYTSDMANKISQIESMATNFATGTFQLSAPASSFSFNCPFLPSFLAVFMQILTPQDDFRRTLESGIRIEDTGTNNVGRTMLIYDGNYFYSYYYYASGTYPSAGRFELLYKYNSTSRVYSFPTITLNGNTVTVDLSAVSSYGDGLGKLYGGKLTYITENESGESTGDETGDNVTYRWIAIK